MRNLTRAFTVFLAAFAVVISTVTPMASASASASTTTSVSASQTAGDLARSTTVKTSLAGFNPGNIISDVVFTNKNTMTEAQIQSFFNSKVSKCVVGKDENGKPYVCLKDFKITSVNRQADAYCSGYKGAANESAARIIYRVAQACNINPQVLIVMLQKEQGLVTHVWPSVWRYNIALGQGCPDTAPCDPNYIGFFHQIYGAARQMQIYMEGKYFQWYAPGKTWGILYHPNASCGRGNVYVANKATAALYYYTPYQPNAAALRANYGEGDGCSSYGNRNFYNYFTDWFGSTQSGAGSLTARLIQNGDPVYLISGTTRYHVQKAEYSEFVAAFGEPTRVDASLVNSYSDGGAAMLYLRNASTGDVSYLRGGERHRFPSCDMVAAWGSRCDEEMRLTAADYARVKAGAEMTWFATTAYNSSTMLIEDDLLRPVYDAPTAKKLNGGTTPYAALMPSSVATTYGSGRTKFLTSNYLMLSGAPEVLLPTMDGRLIHLAAWEYSAEFGLPGTSYHRDVAASAIAGYTREGTLTLFASCGSTMYAAAGKKLYPVQSTSTRGFDVPALDSQICNALSLQKTAALDRIFVQGSGQNEVYYADNGVYRHVTTRAAMNELTGGFWPTILTLSTSTIAKLPKGDKIVQTGGGTLPAGEFVRSDTSTRVYLPLAGDTKLYLPAWTYASELGLPQTQKTVASKTLDAFSQSGTLGLFVVCDSQTYLAARGTLHPIAADAVKGFSSPALDAATCAMLRIAKEDAATAVYVQGVGQNEVYVAQNGVFRHVTSRAALTKLAGGVWPTIFNVNSATITVLPKGSAIN